MSAQTDMAKAKAMRAMGKSVRDPVAKLVFEDAAGRLEKRAAKGAKKVARQRRKKPGQVVAR